MESMRQVYNTVLEMLNDRGHDISLISKFDEEDPSFSSAGIKVFFTEPKVGIKSVKVIEESLETDHLKHVIIIYETSITPSAKQYLLEMSKTFDIEIFRYSQLMFNVTKHCLVPKHEIMDNTFKKSFCQEHLISEKNLPRILHTDPVARYYNMKKGQMVKITRPSETAGTFVTYRICV
tara:strand:+ start:1896 stop:2429 length:534 start_codon:yes stop_codon:yes gene_type:complete